MRITNSMMIASTVRNINNAAKRLNEANERMSSQQKIQLASDDPVVATRAIKYRNYVDTVAQYQSNVSDVTSWQQVTENAISNLNEVITSIREKVSQASSDTLTDDELADIKVEIEELRNSAIEIMNTSYAGRYIFGGYSTNKAPYALVSTLIAGAASTNTTGYASDGSAITALSGLTDGSTYTITTVANGSNFDITLTDATGNVIATATDEDVTDGVTLIGTGGETITLAAAAGVMEGEMKFTVNSAEVVTFKGKYLSFVTSSDVTDAAIASICANNAVDTYETTSAQKIKINIGFNSETTLNVEGQDVTGEGDSNLFNTIAKLLFALDGKDSAKTVMVSGGGTTVSSSTDMFANIDDLLTDLDEDTDRLLAAQSTLGARINYVSMVADRLATDYTTYTTLMSNNEDVDVAAASTEVSTAEYVYEASLSVGAKVITKTLIDYLS